VSDETDIERLIEGFRAFRRGPFEEQREHFERLAEEGQKPAVMVIGCSDSRVDPAHIFSAGPGQLFVVRNVANLVPPSKPDSEYHGTSAALEFAVTVLGVRHIIVLGHAGCGGIEAYRLGRAGKSVASDFIAHWIALVGAADEDVEGESDAAAQRRLEQASIGASIDNLMSFPFVREAAEAGRLTLHGAYYDLATGELLGRDPASGAFKPLA